MQSLAPTRAGGARRLLLRQSSSSSSACAGSAQRERTRDRWVASTEYGFLVRERIPGGSVIKRVPIYTESWQTLQGSFSDAMKPIFPRRNTSCISKPQPTKSRKIDFGFQNPVHADCELIGENMRVPQDSSSFGDWPMCLSVLSSNLGMSSRTSV